MAGEKTYEIDPITPFDEDTQRRERSIAGRIFATHYAHRRPDPDNCEACAIAAYNYAGWLPLYAAAGRPVDREQFVAELDTARVENSAYYRRCLESIMTFGITVR